MASQDIAISDLLNCYTLEQTARVDDKCNLNLSHLSFIFEIFLPKMIVNNQKKMMANFFFIMKYRYRHHNYLRSNPYKSFEIAGSSSNSLSIPLYSKREKGIVWATREYDIDFLCKYNLK